MEHQREIATLLKRIAFLLESAPPPDPPKLTPKEPLKRLFSYDEVAVYLGVSRRKALLLAAEGHLPKTMIGSRVLFDRVDVDAYVDRLTRSR